MNIKQIHVRVNFFITFYVNNLDSVWVVLGLMKVCKMCRFWRKRNPSRNAAKGSWCHQTGPPVFQCVNSRANMARAYTQIFANATTTTEDRSAIKVRGIYQAQPRIINKWPCV